MTRDSRQRACLDPGLRSVERVPGGDLGTPARFWIDRRVPEIAHELTGGRPVRVLDLGCHDGKYLDALRDAGLIGAYVGIDVAPSPQWTERRLDGALGAEFCVRDAHLVGTFEPRGFDLIVSITTFEHFERHDEVLAGVVAQLRSGGHLLLVVPSPYSYVLYGDHGFRRYERGATRRWLETAGLSVERVEPVGGVPSFLWHAVWFRASQVAILAGKAALGALAGFSRARAKRVFGKFDTSLNHLQFWHQRTAPGRAAHRALNRASGRLDEVVPGLPTLYAFVARKD